jgi:uncharacterized lipoprotein YmbA
MNGARVAVLVALGAALAGCASSPPMRFYTLSAVGGESANDSAPAAIRVGRVTLPGEIDRSELVQRIDANRLRLAEDDRWAAPLGEMIRRTLSDDLRSRVPAASGEPDLLSVDIEEFIGDANCSVSLRASWTLSKPGANQPATHGYEVIRADAAQACSVAALPAAMSRALAELSTRIVSRRSKP